MTSVESTEPRPRHQWGSIFIALFFIELIVFGPLGRPCAQYRDSPGTSSIRRARGRFAGKQG